MAEMKGQTEMTETEVLDCGHNATPQGMASGTAHTPDGRVICLRCAEKAEIEDMRTASDFFAYISDDNKTVTTWTGVKLGDVMRRTVSQGRWSYVRVTDVHGGHWYGSGPVENGQYVRLHRSAK